MPKSIVKKTKEGINGWLILFILYLIILIIKQPISAIKSIKSFSSLPTWIMTYTWINNALLFFGSILFIISLILIFKKSHIVIKYNIYLFIFLAIAVFGLNVWFFILIPQSITKNVLPLLINLITDALIISYFFKSKRAKNTFVN